jgi:peptidoglycan biosynthesis protein MviN/MurJ (putative lipid II flippase)
VLGPLPLGVAVINSSGLMFPRVAQKHRLQKLDHFNECIKQQAVQFNIFTAEPCALKV